MVNPDQRINDAISYAARKHRGQWRKHSNAPYIVHPLEVVKRLGFWGIDRNEHWQMWCAAILHDVVEDCGVTPLQIKHGFGKVVRNMVVELTFRERRQGEHHDLWREAKKEYLESFNNKSVESLVIKLADRVCNIADYSVDRPDYAHKYCRQSKPLFIAFTNRESQVKRRFGPRVNEHIKLEILMSCYAAKSLPF